LEPLRLALLAREPRGGRARDPRELLEELQEDVTEILADIEALMAELGERGA
jgi:hypothetical protein